MKSFHISLFLIGILLPALGLAQCREDAAWQDAWTSCQLSPNPNPTRGESHWLHYDLGQVYPLTGLHIWNANQIGLTERGIKRFSLDYSRDGSTWETVGDIDLPQAPGTAYYTGEEATELDTVGARYVLLTVQETWGDSACVSLHEVSFRLEAVPLPSNEDLWLYPNPTQGQAINLSFASKEAREVTVQIYTLTGQLMLSQERWARKGEQNLRIQLPNISAGLYLVRVTAEEQGVIGMSKLVVN